MSIDITVLRYGGNKPGDDIFDVLLTEESAAVARGFGELNKQSVTHRDVALDVPYLPNLEMGKIVYANESLSGKAIVGRVTGIAVSGSKQEPNGSGGPSLNMVLTLECPTNFADE